MYNLCDTNKVEGVVFNLTTYRRMQIQKALTSSSPEAAGLKNYINNLVNQSPNETVESVSNYITEWILKGWKYNPLDPESKIIRMVDSKKTLATSGKANYSKRTVDETTFGADIKIDHIYDFKNHDDDIDRIQTNYKYILTGIMKIANSVGKTNFEGMKIKTLYTNWLHMINNQGVKFIDPLQASSKYNNQKEPNRIINSYTKSASDVIPIEDKMRTALEAYIHSSLGGIDVGQTFESFLIDSYFLFTEGLKIDMFKRFIKYEDRDIDKEIEEMSRLFPDTKFTEEFIRKTNSLEEWFNYRPEDLDNEFSIKPYVFTLPPTELEGLVPLDDRRYVELSTEESSLSLAYHLSRRLTGEEAKIYEKIYNSRLDILKQKESTYQIALAVQDLKHQITPPIVFENGLEVFELGNKLQEDFFNYRGIGDNPVDQATKDTINKAISNYINSLSATFYDYYKRRDWSRVVMEGENPILEIRDEIQKTLMIRNGIFHLLDKPLFIELTINFGSLTIGPRGKHCVITEDYLLIYPNIFVTPKIEKQEGKIGLAVSKIYNRSNTGASYR